MITSTVPAAAPLQDGASPPVVYHGNSKEPFSLLFALRRVPTTMGRVPEEDQLTTVLAWLCELSPTAADRLARLLLDGDHVALDALGSGPLRVRTQVRLPRLDGTGPLIADFSLAAPDKALQLLVEVKLDADIAVYSTAGMQLDQPNAYLEAWRKCDAAEEARERRVGTVTLRGLEQPVIDGRARDITWRQVLELLSELHEGNQLEPAADAVAHELIYYLEERILPPELADNELDGAVDRVHRIAVGLADAIPGARHGDRATKYVKTGCVSENIHLEAAGEPLTIWIAFTPRRTTYNPVGWPDALQLAVMDEGLSEGVTTLLRHAGFQPLPDRAKSWKPYRIMVPWEELNEAADPVAHGVAWGLRNLKETGVIDEPQRG
jgi:hypothetical protein